MEVCDVECPPDIGQRFENGPLSKGASDNVLRSGVLMSLEVLSREFEYDGPYSTVDVDTDFPYRLRLQWVVFWLQ
jgi:hypothetical protein